MYPTRVRHPGSPVKTLTIVVAAALAAMAPFASAGAQCSAQWNAIGSGPWRQYAAPEEAGFSQAALDAARRLADSVQSGAVMAVYRGHALAAWGDVRREFQLHSVRKSLLSALMGQAAAEGAVDLDATLEQLGIDDVHPLTPAEQRARVRDLLAARSGVYLPAAYAPESQDRERPARGSHPPDTHWFYNNWDFNVAESIFERETGDDLYEAFERRIARPLGMEDYEPSDGFRAYEPGLSQYPAHTFRMSTRDLARFGQLYLQRGCWDGRQVIPASWVDESTAPHSDLGDGQGYAYLWWTYAPGFLSVERYPTVRDHAVYLARGTGGQAVFVIPDAEMVVVHRGDTDHGRGVAGPNVWRIVELILAARVGSASPEPRLEPLDPTPLASQLPAPAPRTFVELDAKDLTSYLGRYELAPEAIVRVFSYDGKPFIAVPGEGEAELFQLARDEFTVRVVPGVRIWFERDDTGAVTWLNLTLGSETMRARRVP